MWKYVVLLLFAGVITVSSSDDSRLVTIRQGPVRGYKEPEGGVYAFYNIPYATAPTGTNRFKAPLDPPVWMSTFDAVDRKIACPQVDLYLIAFNLNAQEDCLVANVYTPDTNESNLPVIVNIHGGAMQLGHGNDLKFNALVQTKKVIVITFNYRLGPHGFLCLGTEGAPGNAGLKDQVALLRWVRLNIASFGGNPEDVSLMGCSAGSGSIDFLTLSKLTTGLFKRGIMGSGAAFGGVSPQIDPIKNAQTYAKLLNFNDVNNLTSLEEFYKTASFEQLNSLAETSYSSLDSVSLFAPCVERDVGEEMFLEEAPINIIKQGIYNKVPLLYGLTDMEGMLRVLDFSTWRYKMNENFADFLPGELHFDTEEEKADVAKTVKEFYFGDEPVGENNILSYVDYFTDTLFSYAMLNGLKNRVESVNDTIYLYLYTFEDENTMYVPFTTERGAYHCSQERAIADEDESNITLEYSQMKATLREFVQNFITTSSPVTNALDWPPAGANGSPHMSIGRTILLEDSKIFEERMSFWDRLYQKHVRVPIPPNQPSGSPISRTMISNIVLLLTLMLINIL